MTSLVNLKDPIPGNVKAVASWLPSLSDRASCQNAFVWSMKDTILQFAICPMTKSVGGGMYPSEMVHLFNWR